MFGFCITLLTFLLGLGTFIGWEDFKRNPSSDQLSLHSNEVLFTVTE
jgi:hypothetical protein